MKPSEIIILGIVQRSIKELGDKYSPDIYGELLSKGIIQYLDEEWEKKNPPKSETISNTTSGATGKIYD